MVAQKNPEKSLINTRQTSRVTRGEKNCENIACLFWFLCFFGFCPGFRVVIPLIFPVWWTPIFPNGILRVPQGSTPRSRWIHWHLCPSPGARRCMASSSPISGVNIKKFIELIEPSPYSYKLLQIMVKQLIARLIIRKECNIQGWLTLFSLHTHGE